jgi:hypothetical protein
MVHNDTSTPLSHNAVKKHTTVYHAPTYRASAYIMERRCLWLKKKRKKQINYIALINGAGAVRLLIDL